MIECEPAVSDVVENFATCPERGPDPSTVLPSRKLTLPVGVPDVALTVAVNSTELCTRAGLLLVASVVEVAALLIAADDTVSE